MPNLVQCVKCSICNRLHEVNSGSYIELSGKIRIPLNEALNTRFMLMSWEKALGTETEPGIVCRGVNANSSQDCLIKFLELGDRGY